MGGWIQEVEGEESLAEKMAAGENFANISKY